MNHTEDVTLTGMLVVKDAKNMETRFISILFLISFIYFFTRVDVYCGNCIVCYIPCVIDGLKFFV